MVLIIQIMLANKTLQLKLHRHHQVANNISPIPPSGGTIPRHSTFLAHRAEATNHGIVYSIIWGLMTMMRTIVF
jgi:hypothetical protein